MWGPNPWLTTGVPVLALALLLHSLVGLIAIWAALGRPHWFIRLAVLGGLLSLGLPIGAHDLILIFATQSVLVLVTLTLVRARLGRTSRHDDATTSRAAETRRGPQFSILDLLLATAVVAAVVALAVRVSADVWEVWTANVLVPLFWPQGMPVMPAGLFLYCPFPLTPAAPWLVFGGVAVFFGLSTLAAAWIGLGRRLLWLRLIVFCLIPTSAIMAVWLALWREARHSGREEGRRGASDAVLIVRARSRVVRRWAARIAIPLISLAILVVLGRVYYVLATPLPIPETAIPENNAYATLVRAGQSLEDMGAIDVATATQEELADLVRPKRAAFEPVRAALAQPCQVPVDYGSVDLKLEDLSSLRSLARAFHAEGKLAEMEGRTEDAVEDYRDMIRLSQAGARGGLLIHALVGWAIEALGVAALRDARATLDSTECRELIDFLRSIDAAREPFDEILRRDQAWVDHAYGWQGRLSRMLEKERDPPPGQEPAWAAKARMRLLVAELAIQMYRQDHGQPPETLADLVPRYLRSLPQEPFRDQPLVYRLTSTDYLLYSVGPDGQDDGGQNTPWWRGNPSDLFLDDPPEEEEGEEEESPWDGED